MIIETIDPKTGTLLFNEDEDTKNIRFLLSEIERLTKRIDDLEQVVGYLMNTK